MPNSLALLSSKEPNQITPLSILDRPIEYLKGVGLQRGEVLKKELNIHTCRDLLMHFPFRYIDKTKITSISELSQVTDYVQVKGVLQTLQVVGQSRSSRLVGRIKDQTGTLELVWFKGVKWLRDNLEVGEEYIVFGKTNTFKGRVNMPHPEMELAKKTGKQFQQTLSPMYSSTELSVKRGLDARGIRKLVQSLIAELNRQDVPENLPAYVIQKLRLTNRYSALTNIHFPSEQSALQEARKRLKFEELFFLQLGILRMKSDRQERGEGLVFANLGDQFHNFYNNNLAFELTAAQKRVLKEIRSDLRSGKQMNRLLQGDVGSGKTVVALMTMLMGLDNDFQCCMMAPTEILAQQHYHTLKDSCRGLGVQIAFLSGNVKGKKRSELLKLLEAGEIHILVGTHALIESPVKFANLGLAVIDEQHRFGVAQRAKLWEKGAFLHPHVLIMTATPIPRTLAMTVYGHLDVSVIDELPPGRKPVKTVHISEAKRLWAFGLIKREIQLGRQIYVVYPLIEESAKLDLQNLDEGYEALSREFPKPNYQIGVVHGRMKPQDKDFEMDRFVKHETNILVATTVIEVGVNVQNASVMIIESAERFGLSQLHQLRGRVGRGADQSYCILLSKPGLGKDAKARMKIMTETSDGFKISEEDLKLRGPGNMLGTQQSGVVQFRIANILEDYPILNTARKVAQHILDTDPDFTDSKHQVLSRYLSRLKKGIFIWGKIS